MKTNNILTIVLAGVCGVLMTCMCYSAYYTNKLLDEYEALSMEKSAIEEEYTSTIADYEIEKAELCRELTNWYNDDEYCIEWTYQDALYSYSYELGDNWLVDGYTIKTESRICE